MTRRDTHLPGLIIGIFISPMYDWDSLSQRRLEALLQFLYMSDVVLCLNYNTLSESLDSELSNAHKICFD